MIISAETQSEIDTRPFDKVMKAVEPDDGDFAPWFAGYCREHKTRIMHDYLLLEELFSKTDKVLEVGSVPLLFTGLCKVNGHDVTGLDIDPTRFQSAIDRLGLNVVKGCVETEKLPFDDDSFDVIIFNEIFEHLRINLIDTFSELHRVLKPGGRIVMSTPNGLSLKHLLSIVRRGTIGPDVYDQYSKLKSISHMGHVREYSVTEVCTFLKKAGFCAERLIYRGTIGSRLYKMIYAIFPKLRPFFTVIATKVS